MANRLRHSIEFATTRASLGFTGVLILLGHSWVAANDSPGPDGRQNLLKSANRILFLGDSITYDGRYVAMFDVWLQTLDLNVTGGDGPPTVINAGLPSETVSGLSEEGHAGGKFPRPDLAERLRRVLKLVKPDLIVACYGMNCGIYQPFDAERFVAFRRGIERLRREAKAIDAEIVHVTPPCYDDQRRPLSFEYNQVLGRYSSYLLDRAERDVWRVIDLHGPMTATLKERRQTDASFMFQRDGVHPNQEGHEFIAKTLITWFADASGVDGSAQAANLAATHGPLRELVHERLQIGRDAYLQASGHLRPGIREGFPLPEAKQKARAITRRIDLLRKRGPQASQPK